MARQENRDLILVVLLVAIVGLVTAYPWVSSFFGQSFAGQASRIAGMARTEMLAVQVGDGVALDVQARMGAGRTFQTECSSSTHLSMPAYVPDMNPSILNAQMLPGGTLYFEAVVDSLRNVIIDCGNMAHGAETFSGRCAQDEPSGIAYCADRQGNPAPASILYNEYRMWSIFFDTAKQYGNFPVEYSSEQPVK